MSRTAPRCSRVPPGGRARWSAVLGTALGLASAAGASAQSGPHGSAAPIPPVSFTAPDSTWLVQDSVARRCLDTLSEGSLRSVTVYQIATPSDTSEPVLAQAALISQAVAERVRVALGGDSGSVPAADTLVTWRHLAGHVPIRLVVHREAATTWSIDSGADTAKTKLAALYASVLRAMPDDRLDMVWPEHLAPDSVTILFELTSAESSTRPLPRPDYPMIAVFRTRGVGFTPAIARRNNPVPRYPLDAEQQRVRVEVIMGIVVRPSGRADGSTRSVVISSPGSISSGTRERFAREFTSVVERVMKAMRFEPARVGGCAVPQQADFPFTFERG